MRPVTSATKKVNASTRAVDSDLVQTRNVGRPELANRRDAEQRDAESGHSAHERQQHVFRQQLSQKTRAIGAHGGANRHLLLANRRARQQQVGNVATGDQQHEADGAEQHVEGEAHVADDLVDQRNDADRQTAVRRIVGRILLLHSIRDSVHLGLRAFDGDAGLERREDVVVLAVALRLRAGGQRQRKQQIDVLNPVHRRHDLFVEREVFRHHADHGEVVAVERERLADDRRIGAEASLPESVRENHRQRLPRLILFGGKHSAQCDVRAEDGKERR